MTTRSFTLQIAADIAKYQAQFAKIPGFTEAKAAQAAKAFAFKMHAAQEKVARDAEKAAAKAAAAHEKQAARAGAAWGRATDGADNRLHEVGEKAGDAESAIRGMSGAIGMVSPEAERALNVVAELGGATEGAARGFKLLGVDMGAIASKGPIVAVAIAGIATATAAALNATQSYRLELREVRDLLDDINAPADSLIVSTQSLGTASDTTAGFIADLQIQTGLLEGSISDTDVKAGQLGSTFADTLAPQLQAAALAFAENQARIDDLTAALDRSDISIQQRATAIQQLGDARAVQPQLVSQLEEIRGLMGEGNAAISDYTNAIDRKREADRRAAEEERRRRKAEADGRRKKAEAEREAAREAAQLAAAQQEIAATAREASLAIQTEVGRTITLYDEQLDRLDALEAKYGEQVDTAGARAALEAQHIHDLEAMRLASIERINAAQEEAAKEEAARQAAARAETQRALSDVGTVFGAVSDMAAQAASSAATEEAAEQARQTAKRLARIEILAAAAAGAVNIASRAALRPVAAAAAGLALATTTATSLSQVERLHSGGYSRTQLAPDERVRASSVVTVQERTVTERGARNLGEETIRAAERGQTFRPQIVVVEAFQNYGRFSQNELRRASPSSRALDRNRTGVTGQRSY